MEAITFRRWAVWRSDTSVFLLWNGYAWSREAAKCKLYDKEAYAKACITKLRKRKQAAVFEVVEVEVTLFVIPKEPEA